MESQLDENKLNNNLILLCILIAVFVVPTSISGTAIALPSISENLRSETVMLQWFVNGFNLTFACFTLVWGGLADVFGSKRSFIAGAILYFVASLSSWLAQNIYILDGARALAGIGGAAIFSCGSSILIQTFNGAQRTKAFAFFGTIAGLGITFGPTLSGWVLSMFGWRDIFLIHAVALLIVLVLSRLIPGVISKGSETSLDVKGIILFVFSLFLIMFGITQGAENGWYNTSVISMLLSGVGLLLIFTLIEKKVSNPMINFSLLTNHYFLSLILIPVVASLCFVTLLTYFPTYLIAIEGMSPLHAGFMMLALTLPVLVLPLIAGKLVTKGVSANKLLILSLLSFICGLLLLCIFNSLGITLSEIIVCLLLVGTGMGLSAGLVDGIALSIVQPSETGRAAGILNTFRLGSEAIAVAIYGSLMSSGIYHAMSSKFSNTIYAEKIFIADVVSGNAFSYVSDHENDILKATYKLAFSNTLLILLIASGVVTAAIFLMLKDKDKKYHP